MYKNNLFRLDLNSTQITKTGLYIGGKTFDLDVSNFPYLCGVKHKTSYIDISETLLNLKKLYFLQRKTLLKCEFTVIVNDNKEKIKKNLNQNINNDNLFNVKILKNFRFGLVSNNEVRSKFLILKKTDTYDYRNFFKNYSLSNNSKSNNKIHINKCNYPSLLVLLGYDKNILLEFKNKNIVTSCIIDTNNFNFVSDYNILLNNKSIISLSYFSKLFKI